MNIEKARKEISRVGVAFPRIGLGSTRLETISNGGGRVLLPSDTGKVVLEDRYDQYMSKQGLVEERRDLFPRTEASVKFLIEVRELVAPSIENKWNKALNNFARTVLVGDSALSLINSEVNYAGDSLREYIIDSSLKIGVQLEIYDALNNLRKLAPQANFQPEVAELVDEAIGLVAFSDAGPVITPMGNFSIADVMDDRGWEDIGLDRLLDLVMNTGLARRRVDLNRIFPENYSLAQMYPQTTMSHLHDASFLINNAFYLNALGVNRMIRIPEFMIAQKGMGRIADRFSEIQKAFSLQLFSPNSDSFTGFSEVVNRYLYGERDEAIMVLHRMGLNEDAAIVKASRQSRELVLAGKNPEFFGLFGSSIKEMIEEGRLSETFYVPTKDDLATVLDDEKVDLSVSDEGVYRTISSQVSFIFQKKSIPEYVFDVGDVDWGNLVPPQEASITFQSKPHKFSINLNWSNNVGESLKVKLDFDSKNSQLDWNFIEGADDSSMEAMKKASSLLAVTLLSVVEKDIDSQIEAQRKNSTAKELGKVRSEKRERNEDEIYTIRKEARKGTPSSIGTVTSVSSESKDGIKKTIAVPELELLHSLLSNLGSVDQDIVDEAIRDFNNRGVGKFTRKRQRNDAGEPIYTLAVGCTTPKGARILLRENQSSEGLRTFEIVDIRYRKDIYRKAKI